MGTRNRPPLPNSVMDMKFMRKTKERIERELENMQDHEGLYSGIITDEMRHTAGDYISESSINFCEELIEGRVSFKERNPEKEKVVGPAMKKDTIAGEMEKGVSDDILSKKMNKINRRKRPSSPNKYNILKKKK